MKFPKTLLDGFNQQIQKEYDSSYIYTGMELYFKNLGISGFEKFFKRQAEEEREHAEDFTNFVFDMNESVELFALSKPKTDYGSILEAFEAGLAHEKFISNSISELLTLAIKEGCYAAENFLRKYIDEQVEEEASFQSIVDTIKFLGDDKAAIFSYAKSLGSRE